MSFSVIEIRTAKTITDGIQSDADWIRHPPSAQSPFCHDWSVAWRKRIEITTLSQGSSGVAKRQLVSICKLLAVDLIGKWLAND